VKNTRIHGERAEGGREGGREGAERRGERGRQRAQYRLFPGALASDLAGDASRRDRRGRSGIEFVSYLPEEGVPTPSSGARRPAAAERGRG